MADEKKIKREPYLKRLISFYFAPKWQSFLTILYLLVFLQSSAFYSGHLLIAYRFVVYTVKNSVSLLGLDYLFWGAAFTVSLIIPFSISLYAIFFLHNLWSGEGNKWTKDRRILVSAVVVISVPLIIILMDMAIRIVADQDVLYDFIVRNGIRISGVLAR